MHKVLIVEDEEHIAELIKYNLEIKGFDTSLAIDGYEATEKANLLVPHLILLDIMLPKRDGIEVCKMLKTNNKTKDIPIIMLTAKSEELDKVLGLEIGADDYITKPFSVRELLARIKAVLRRSYKDEEQVETLIKFGDIVIDIEKHTVVKDGKIIELTLKEFKLLKILAENKGKVLSRNFLLDEVWGYDYFGETRTVDVHIRHLRKKIGDNMGIIETVRGVGYKIK
ncbi:winged helix-turn-helix domain-containing protein [Abyssisolibacter fermentans]|uniref:winged helix-turn-helix domain-containing protein n=1 Tax=Abyssisolibacter fermentans TaxID=1766203 RepID=UPI000AD899A7|nr:response regulator transcription factor [Abyssisolibacter fermentans]